MNAFDRKVLAVVVGLALVLGAVVLAGSLVGMSAPELARPLGADAWGANGPLTLTFTDAMQVQSVETRILLEPAVEGRLAWSGEKVLSFWPDRPLEAGKTYTLHLQAGAQSRSGQVIRLAQKWAVTVREPEILYLSPTEAPEIWRSAVNGESPAQLTSTGGKIFDFAVALDGSHVVYSAGNEQGGIDLWEMGRSGGEARLLLPCQADWCVNPAYAPDGSRLVYTRRRASLNQGGSPGVPRLWMLELPALTTEDLYVNPDVGGFEPVWSPDGRYLAFFDGISHGVRVLDVQAQTDFLVESDMGLSGAWSPDSRRLLYNDYEIDSAQPSMRVYEVDVQTQEVRVVLGKDETPTDYSIPAWSPEGEELVIGLRAFSGAPGKQLWLLRPDEAGQLVPTESITRDPGDNYAAYRWSPAGDQLVYQQLELGSSRSRPTIVVWDRQSDEHVPIAVDAFSPQWLP